MIVKFNTKDVSLSERVLGTMENKLHLRLDKYFKSKKGDETVILVKITEKKPIFTVEINLSYGGYQLRTEVADKNGVLPALDKAMDTMERQVTKCKERISRRSKGQKPADASSALPPAYESDGEEEEYRVVKIKIYEMKPMTAQEAILQMEFLGHNFYVFNNIENNKVCTVYRRNDGDYGLIEPAN